MRCESSIINFSLVHVKNGPECQKSVNKFLDHFVVYVLDFKLV